MRLTTRIIIGIILFIFTLTLLTMIGFSFTKRKHFERRHLLQTVFIPQEPLTVLTLPAFETILVELTPGQMNDADEILRSREGCLSFESDAALASGVAASDATPGTAATSALGSGPGRLFLPEALRDFVSTELSQDTLRIRVDARRLYRSYQTEENRHREYSLAGIHLRFVIPAIDVVNKVQELAVRVKDVETDRIRIDSYGEVFLEGCKAEVITPVMRTGYKQLTLDSCMAQTMNLDLDHARHWNKMPNCTIREMNLTGSGTHQIVLPHGMQKQGMINWLPKDRKAQLDLRMQGDTTRLLIR